MAKRGKSVSLRALARDIQRAERRLRKLRAAAKPAAKKAIDLQIRKLGKFEKGIAEVIGVHIPHAVKLQGPHIPHVLKMKPHIGKPKQSN